MGARQTQLAMDLGGEKVELIRLEAIEALSQHFTISLDLLLKIEVDLLPHLGKPVTVGVSEDDQHQRYFNGIAIDGELLEEIKGAGFIYRMTLRPAAWLHSQGRDFKIFQNKTTKDIVQAILDQCGITAEFKLSGATPNRSYCVQYGESNFAFVSRLMEEEGLYYFYEHVDGDHVLTICDSPNSHDEGVASPLKYTPYSGSGGNVDSATRFAAGQTMHIQSWHERVSTGAENKVTLRDFDFMRPDQPRQAEKVLESAHKLDAIEVYDFPGRFFVEDTGNSRAEALLEARRANRRTYSGDSHNAAIACGTTFKLKDHPNSRFNREYLVTHVQHSVAVEHHRSGMSEAGGNRVRFEAVPSNTKWRPPLTARRPVVYGPETAIVTGPEAETIYTDKFGRVKVQFHWDRQGKHDADSSCWIRVSHSGLLGNTVLPRVGHEVVVDFMGGDPDRPVIIGRLYNQANMPVYALPDHKTKAVWRTLTYGEPVPANAKKELDTKCPLANELRFEDKAGSEEVLFHAQRDMNIRTILNQTNHIGNDLEIDVGQHRSMTIGVDDTVEVGNNRVTDILSNETRTIANNRSTSVGTNDTLAVGEKIKIDAGKQILIEAGQKIVLKVGGSTITIKPTSIDIKTTKLTMKAAAKAQLSSPMTKVDASGILTLQGSLVKIN